MTIVKECKDCCKICPDCPNCYDLDIEKIRQYTYAIDQKISEYNQSFICLSTVGYGCKNVSEEQYEKLHIFKQYLDTYLKSLRLNYFSGLCPTDVQRVLEATYKLINLDYHSSEDFSYVEIDTSEFESWVLQNPTCVAWEDWEYYIPKFCIKVGIEVTDVQKACNLMYDIKVGVIQDCSKFLYTLSIASKAKEQNCIDKSYEIIITNPEQCKLDYKVLVDEFKCDFTYDTYVSLLECNLSHKVISNLLECNVGLRYSKEGNTPIIVTKNGAYKLDEIDINLFDQSINKKHLNALLGTSKNYSRGDLKVLVDSYSNSPVLNI